MTGSKSPEVKQSLPSAQASDAAPASVTAPQRPLAEKIIHWQQSHGRHQLPWQQDVTPYKVLVSELMLQQTQVATVIPYFQRWLAAFPDVAALAAADEDEVMRLWQGLGYYARARNLQKAARYITALGAFPATLDGLLQVPGVGRYTAGAIMSFAYQQYGPIVDGNVRRLYSRLFAVDGMPGSKAHEKKLWALAEQLTPQHQESHRDCKSFAQGLLDLGATICKPRQPLCDLCPLNIDCQALMQNRVSELPNPKPKKAVPERDGHFLLRVIDGKVLLQKRPSPGIWAALWCLPQTLQAPLTATLHGTFSHQFTHYKLNASVWLWQDPSEGVTEAVAEQFVALTALDSVGLPAPLRLYLSALARVTA